MDNVPLSLPQKTVYFSLAMQMYMAQEIKKPLLEIIDVLFGASKHSKVDKLKALRKLWEVFQSLKGLPEPTKENTWHPNTHNLIDLRDYLFEYCHLNKLRMGFLWRVVNFIIVIYDFDPPWRWIFDSLREEATKMEWKSRGFHDTWVQTYEWWGKDVEEPKN